MNMFSIRHARRNDRLINILALTLSLVTTDAVWAQGSPPPCVVVNASQLQNVLDCIASGCTGCGLCPGGCPTEILIPALHPVTQEPVRIQIGATVPFIHINEDHSSAQRPLTIRIHGTILWVGGESCPLCGYKVFDIYEASHLTIDGDNLGLITANDEVDPAEQNVILPQAIRIRGDSHTITVRDLKITRLGYMINAAPEIPEPPAEPRIRHNLTFIGLVGEELSEYGIYPDADIVTVENCRVGDPSNPNVIGTYQRYGYRLYGDNVTIEDYIAHNMDNNSSLYMVAGDDVLIDGFAGNALFHFGPNPAYPPLSWPEDKLHNVEIRDVQIAHNPLANFQGILVELGTWRACLFDVSTDESFVVGRMSNDPPGGTPHRPLNRIHWANLTASNISIVDNPNCIGADIGPADCWGDIDGNDEVNVDDLVAVILTWGPCPAPPETPNTVGDPCPTSLSPCHADIVPFVCGDNAVDADDLVQVILNWGPCSGGEEDLPPQTIQDCWDKCSEAHAVGSPEFEECYYACIFSLYQQGLLP
jgi:ferredoxin